MKEGIRSFVVLSAVVALGDTAAARQAQQLPPSGSVSSAAVLCVDEIKDQSGGACLRASSIPTFGLLFPYPGLNNVFTPTAFVGGGKNNKASSIYAAVGGGRNNTASGGNYYGGATVGGGKNNTASGDHATIGGGSDNKASGWYATVGGGLRNTATYFYATVGGGYRNTAYGFFGTVAGGNENRATGHNTSVGGGQENTASGLRATIGGGFNNTAGGQTATIGGGGYNTASGDRATVGGGFYSAASGDFATVPGGFSNLASGGFSFAAGRRAKANHDGAFVWGDSQDLMDKPSSVPNEFNVYCSGGARFFSNSAATTGVLLASGGGSWTAVSDRDSKENLESVDARDVLDRVVALPLSTWNYKAQPDSIRHMGPMAQDFYAAFGLGLGDRTIDTIDPDGVALAAIQGLNAVVAEKDAEIAALRARVDRLETLALALEAHGEDR